MPSKEHIIDEIQRVAEKIGRAPGRTVFEKETGIRMPEWYGVYWRAWGDAIEESGLKPNKKQGKFSTEDVLVKYAQAVRHFGRIPAEIDIRMYSRENADFPGHSTFANHFGNKDGMVRALAGFVRREDDYADLINLVPLPDEPETELGEQCAMTEGHVYLLKSGDHYKIGRSDELERRVKQIAVNLPEAVTLEHAIRTDDPPGIEAYWHRRFTDRRANGEWFKLTVADIRAFKRRKYQ